MKLFTSKIRFVVLLSAGFLLTACATYYKVTDPSSGNIYYTEKVKNERGGAAKFKDARSGAEVTIQNSEVLEISGKEFDAGLKTPVTKAVPAPSTTPTTPAPSTAPTPEPEPAPAPAPAPDEGSAPEQGAQ